MPSRLTFSSFAWDAWRAERRGYAAVMARQRARLGRLVRFARARSALYRELYQGMPLEIEHLGQLRPVTKQQLMARFDDWVTDPRVGRAGVEAFLADKTLVGQRYLGRYTVFTTSGSTGESGICVHDAEALTLYRALTLVRGWLPWMTPERLWPVLRQGARVAGVFATGDHYASSGMLDLARRRRPRPFNRVRVFSALSPLPELVQALNAFRPAELIAYPSALLLLAEEQEAGRLAIRPALVGSGGEWLDPTARRSIEATFGCRVRENYGVTEFGPLGWACREASLHVSADWAILEAVDEAYRPVPAGQASYTTLLTNLAIRVQPIIRYDLGDSVTVRPDGCRCGSPFPAVRVVGRREETLYFRTPSGGEVALLAIPLACVVYQTPGVRRCQVIQTGPAALRVRLEARSGADGQQTWEVAAGRLREYLTAHDLAHVGLEQAAEPPSPDPVSGKHRMVWSERG
ncbi:MAG: phenylacetate--CoA ligase family protein [Chloroflexi bacterium]|nr:phenylacetate--CoA ligase family protein [Chloroflexota bacterium]